MILISEFMNPEKRIYPGWQAARISFRKTSIELIIYRAFISEILSFHVLCVGTFEIHHLQTIK